jgi:hypothetical protein
MYQGNLLGGHRASIMRSKPDVPEGTGLGALRRDALTARGAVSQLQVNRTWDLIRRRSTDQA